ncbi:MAG: InlB B-repeat-containing protein [Candidatus Izemoplasmatales bacterium]|nr:InlB B-repeat-containing protein [Candidatus Izemoplasmatales bacterium]
MKKIHLYVISIFLMLSLMACNKGMSLVSFETYGESSIAAIEVEYRKPIQEPISPVKEGHTFIGWYSDSTFQIRYDFSKPVLGDLLLYARYEINQYTIMFDSNGGTVVESITQDYNSIITEPTNPTKEGYTFLGWYSDSTFNIRYDFSKPIL